MSGDGGDFICWLDLETTGTDERTSYSRLLEIGAVMTDSELNVLGDFVLSVDPVGIGVRSAIRDGHLTQSVADGIIVSVWNAMDPVVQEMHTNNGLWQDCLENGTDTAIADTQLASWIGDTTEGADKVMLAGSGVGHFDMRWLRKFTPRSFELFWFSPHDVGVVRRFMKDIVGVNLHAAVDPNQQSSGDGKAHRALDDAYAHLAEARGYRDTLRSLFKTEQF